MSVSCQAVAMIEKMKTKFSLSYACLANQVGLSYRTLMRWKQRLADGKDAVEKRGPKKVRPLNLNELKSQDPGFGSRPQTQLHWHRQSFMNAPTPVSGISRQGIE
jgi:hypothetical protein